jgi:hypothetical protein
MFGATTLNIMTLSIKVYNVTDSIAIFCHYLSVFADCHILFIIMLNTIQQSVAMLNAVAPHIVLSHFVNLPLKQSAVFFNL